MQGLEVAVCGKFTLLAAPDRRAYAARMHLNEADVTEFATLWREEFGEALSLDEARYQAAHLLELYTLLYRPTPEEQSGVTRNSSTQTP